MNVMLKSAIVAVVIAAQLSVAQAQTKVTVGYTAAGDFLPVFVAKEQGFFAAHGLDVELTRIALASTVPAALLSNSLQIGTGTGPALLQAAEGGLDLVAVAGGARQQSENATVSVVARPDAGILSAADFKGKTVGVPGLNSVIDVVFRKWLIDNAVSVADVALVETPFPQMNDILRAGTVDAVAVLEPFRSKIVGDGNGVKVADYFAEVKDGMAFGFWIASRAWADGNPEAVAAFRAASSEAVAFIADNPEAAKAIETTYLGVATPGFASFDVEITAADLADYIAIGKELDLLRTDIDPATLIAD